MRRLQQKKHKLGSDAIITLVLDDVADEARIFKELWRIIDEFEARFSRFRAESELSYFNRNSGQRVKVSAEFIDLLKACRYFSDHTGGLFNPFILPTLQKLGYKGSWPYPDVHDPSLDMSRRRLVLPSALKIYRGAAEIPDNSALDFGGIGKGYLLDKLAEYLKRHNIRDFWVSLGGDIICAGYDLEDTDWLIEIAAANKENRTAAVVNNQDGKLLAIATSGIIKRRGDGWHHIIDPRTGISTNTDVLTATAVCRSATAADIYAKVLVIDSSWFSENVKKPETLLAKALQYTNGSVEIEGQAVIMRGR